MYESVFSHIHNATTGPLRMVRETIHLLMLISIGQQPKKFNQNLFCLNSCTQENCFSILLELELSVGEVYIPEYLFRMGGALVFSRYTDFLLTREESLDISRIALRYQNFLAIVQRAFDKKAQEVSSFEAYVHFVNQRFLKDHMFKLFPSTGNKDKTVM